MRPVRVAALSALVLPALLAHPGHDQSGVAAGLAHPLGGLDHLLAMVAVGLIAARCGGRARWALPLTFLGAMLIGGLIALAGGPMPGVEWAIALSVLVFGALVALGRPPHAGVAAAVIAAFALIHGHAHVAEMDRAHGFAGYAAGFLLATAALHAAGVVGGMLALRLRWQPALRWTGAAIAAVGVMLIAPLVG